jgi:hypothetical protein
MFLEILNSGRITKNTIDNNREFISLFVYINTLGDWILFLLVYKNGLIDFQDN